jgi:hypothetical protein
MPVRLSIDFIRFWILLVPALGAYLVTDRRVKILVLVPIAWIGIEILVKRFGFRFGDLRKARAAAGYFVMAGVSLAASLFQPGQQILFRDLIIIGTPFLMFSGDFRKPRNPSVVLFLLFSLTYLAAILEQSGLKALATLNVTNLFLPSESLSENNFGIVFGLFALHFLMRRKWIWFVFAVVCSLLVSKRTLIIGFLMALGYWIFTGLPHMKDRKPNRVLLFLIYIGLGLSAIFLIEIGEYVLEWAGLSKMGLHHFLMGRDDLLLTLRGASFSGSLGSIFGHGPGSADCYLALKGAGWGPLSDEPFNPHNDHMKLIYDYGYAGYLLFFFVLYEFYAATRRGSVLLVYTMTVFCFENSLIYIVYALTAGFLISEYPIDEQLPTAHD